MRWRHMFGRYFVAATLVFVAGGIVVAQTRSEAPLNRQVLLEPGPYYFNSPAVNIRSRPTVDAPIVATRSFGESIYVVGGAGSDDSGLELGGYFAYWYRVEFEGDRGDAAYGYVWGGGLATDAVIVDLDNDGTDEYILEYRMADHDHVYPAYMGSYRTEYYVGRYGEYWGVADFEPDLNGSAKLRLPDYINSVGPYALLEASFGFGDGECWGSDTWIYWWDGSMFRQVTEFEAGGCYGDRETTVRRQVIGPRGALQDLELRFSETRWGEWTQEGPAVLYENFHVRTDRVRWNGRAYVVETIHTEEPPEQEPAASAY